MMINDDIIKLILHEFQMVDDFVYTFIRPESVGKDTLIKCSISDGDFLIRIYRDDFTTSEGLEMQGTLCELLRINGCPVPKRLKTSEGFYFHSIAESKNHLLVTLEEWMPGHEVQVSELSKQLLRHLGQLLGKMHRISESHDLHLNYGTYWGMFGGNFSDKPGVHDDIEVESINLRNALVKLDVDKQLVNLVFQLFSNKREALRQVWSQLPKGVVQGDLSLNNILLNHKGELQAIIDFNIAGEEVFIAHAIGEGIFLGYELLGDQGDKHYKDFMSAYLEERPLSPIEEYAFPLIVQVVRPFRFRRIQHIVKHCEAGARNKVEEELRTIYKLLTTGHFDEN